MFDFSKAKFRVDFGFILKLFVWIDIGSSCNVSMMFSVGSGTWGDLTRDFLDLSCDSFESS